MHSDGTKASVRPRIVDFFGGIQEKEPFTSEDAKRADREWVGLAPHTIVTLYTTPPAAQPAVPDFKSFKAWANDAGYDTAYTHDGIKWICLNPMTADLWKAWQAATPPAQPAPEDYTALEQALYRLQKRYWALHSKVAAQREWVGLTDEEVREIHRLSFGKDVAISTGLTEAKLKEKNT
jgi:hypothetical protein